MIAEQNKLLSGKNQQAQGAAMFIIMWHKQDGMEGETCETREENVSKITKDKPNENTAGIIYFSKIPTFMSVKKLRQMMEQYGEIGRIFLQPDGR